MTKKALTRPYKMPAPRLCRYCKVELMRNDIVAGRAKEIDETTGICPECLLRPTPQDTKVEPKPPVVERRERKARPVAENETFVTMIVAAQEDKAMRDRILAIARLTSFHRQSLINSLITDLRMHGKKTSSLVSAIACLKDDHVALKTIETLTKQ